LMIASPWNNLPFEALAKRAWPAIARLLESIPR
jgi:hypothetical protein